MSEPQVIHHGTVLGIEVGISVDFSMASGATTYTCNCGWMHVAGPVPYNTNDGEIRAMLHHMNCEQSKRHA